MTSNRGPAGGRRSDGERGGPERSSLPEAGTGAGSAVIRRAIAAFNAGDVECYFRCHSDTTTLEQPDGTVIERDAYEVQTVTSRARWPSLQVHIVRLHDAGATVVMESTVNLGEGGPDRPEAVVFDLTADGLIEHTRIYARASIEMTLSELED